MKNLCIMMGFQRSSSITVIIAVTIFLWELRFEDEPPTTLLNNHFSWLQTIFYVVTKDICQIQFGSERGVLSATTRLNLMTTNRYLLKISREAGTS